MPKPRKIIPAELAEPQA